MDKNIEYVVLPQKSLNPRAVVDYWTRLYEADTLKMRLCNTDNPGVNDAIKLIADFQDQFYYVVDRGRVIAEFMLENFTGSAAQIHFSMQPDNSLKTSLRLASEVTSMILNSWMHPITQKPYLTTLFGLTPISNRPACLFVLKVGFKKLALLPDGMLDRGCIVDAMVTTKRRTV